MDNQSQMRPTMGSRTMMLPLTFDYSGGRKDSNKSKIIFAIGLLIIGIIVSLGVLFNGQKSILLNLPISCIILFVVGLIIRYPMMGEGKVRKDYEDIERNDLERGFEDIWGIYSIDDVYPYYCRFRNGRSGLYIRLNKDVILGKYSESEYHHYEAIGDAYNLVGANNIQMCHVDYMDNVGTDDRLVNSFVNLSRCDNTDVKDLLTDILTYQQNQMMERVTTFDVYLFTWRGSDINAWGCIQQVIACFLEANFISYRVLDRDDLRNLAKTLYNLKDISVVSALMSAFGASTVTDVSGITPIKVVKGTGEEYILGKTREEKEQERMLAEKERELRKKNKRGRKSNKDIIVVEDEIDLFDE